MVKKTERVKELAEKRRNKWNRAEKPYFNWCLRCDLSCKQIIARGPTDYDIMNCPRKHTDTAKFPYKYEDMKRAEEERRKQQ